MLTERDNEVLQILADPDHYESLRSFERDAVRAALAEIDRLRAEIAHFERMVLHGKQLERTEDC